MNYFLSEMLDNSIHVMVHSVVVYNWVLPGSKTQDLPLQNVIFLSSKYNVH